MKLAAVVAILLVSPSIASAAPTKSKAPAAKPKATAPAKAAASAQATTAAPAPVAPAPAAPAAAVETARLRHEMIGIGPGYGSIEAGQAELARKDDDTAFQRSLGAGAATQAAASGPFAAVETMVVKKKPQATGRIRVSFDVDRRGRVQRAIALGFDRALDKAIEKQLATTVLPLEYAGQHVDTVLAFQRGKLVRR
jgi:2-oxoglutarate dehydrogenase E2 component (dihydrolipoamide succinyltransferase)